MEFLLRLCSYQLLFSNMFTGLAQVVLVYYNNRNIKLPADQTTPDNDLLYLQAKDSMLLQPSERLMIYTYLHVPPWNLCTIDQVEPLKALIKLTPIMLTDKSGF